MEFSFGARKGFTELPQSPVGRRMGGDVVMKNLPTTQFHDHEYVKGAESGRNHDEEVARHDQLGVVADESQPALLRIWFSPGASVLQVLLYRPG